MDRRILRYANKIDNDLSRVKHDLAVIWNFVQDDLAPIIDGETPDTQDKLYKALDKVIDSLENAITSLPKQGAITKEFAKIR